MSAFSKALLFAIEAESQRPLKGFVSSIVWRLVAAPIFLVRKCPFVQACCSSKRASRTAREHLVAGRSPWSAPESAKHGILIGTLDVLPGKQKSTVQYNVAPLLCAHGEITPAIATHLVSDRHRAALRISIDGPGSNRLWVPPRAARTFVTVIQTGIG
jgi:hypothetical protein